MDYLHQLICFISRKSGYADVPGTRFAALLFVCLISLPAIAGYYGNITVDVYDPTTGIYFKAVEAETGGSSSILSKGRQSNITNINIFDPSSGKSTLLLKPDKDREITVFIFESGYDEGSIQFNGETFGSIAKNNKDVKERPPKDKIIFGVRDEPQKQLVLYTASKSGSDIRKLASVPFGANWHIDVRNSKLRVIRQTSESISVESYEW